ncbi:MAG: GGDEF domain-containing protein, partial [Candidatus Levybacteria bacterium]|nr:GGDEF domain-containing protein [Candidatus Levybacteria bacterium]
MQDGPSTPIEAIEESPQESLDQTSTVNKLRPSRPFSHRSLKRRITGLKDALGKAETNAMEDSVTGLKSRRWFDGQLEIAVRKAERRQAEIKKLREQGQPVDERDDGSFWMELEDLDDFKQFNTFYLWAGGDLALKTMAIPETRPGEEKARYGGDEFARLINSNITEDEIIRLANRDSETVREESRRAISQLTPRFPEKDGKYPPREVT